MADSERASEVLPEKSFKCCVKKTTKAVVCIQCGNIFHRSCMERKNYKIIDESRIICCTLNDNGNSKVPDLKEDTTSKDYAERITIENNLLKRLIKEQEEKFMILLENKRLLEDKVRYLTEANKKSTQYQYKNTVDNKKNLKSEMSTSRQTDLNEAANKDENKSRFSSSTRQGLPEQKPEEAEGDVQKAQINSDESTSDGFILVERKKNKNKHQESNKKVIGNVEAGNDEGFTGVKPKAWMYLYRVKQHVTDTHIQTYIKKKINKTDDDEEIIVKKLSSENKRHKCFMVGADFDHKDNFYNPSFWPRGVGFKRFDFRRYHDYNRKMENQQEDFL